MQEAEWSFNNLFALCYFVIKSFCIASHSSWDTGKIQSPQCNLVPFCLLSPHLLHFSYTGLPMLCQSLNVSELVSLRAFAPAFSPPAWTFCLHHSLLGQNLPHSSGFNVCVSFPYRILSWSLKLNYIPPTVCIASCIFPQFILRLFVYLCSVCVSC